MTRLYVGNIPYTATSDDLREYFEQEGDVIGVEVPSNKEDGSKNRGFGFVDMSDSDAQRAIEILDGEAFAGRKITVNVAIERPRRNGGFGDRRRR